MNILLLSLNIKLQTLDFKQVQMAHKYLFYSQTTKRPYIVNWAAQPPTSQDTTIIFATHSHAAPQNSCSAQWILTSQSNKTGTLPEMGRSGWEVSWSEDVKGAPSSLSLQGQINILLNIKSKLLSQARNHKLWARTSQGQNQQLQLSARHTLNRHQHSQPNLSSVLFPWLKRTTL